MKNLIHFLVIVGLQICSVELYGQLISRSVFSSSGAQLSTENLTLSATIGQSGLVGSFNKATYHLNVGFQQMDAGASTVVFDLYTGVKVLLYPNPFKDEFQLAILAPFNGRLSYTIYDIQGSLMLRSQTIPFLEVYRETVHMDHLPSGTYQIEMVLQNAQRVQQLNKIIIRH